MKTQSNVYFNILDRNQHLGLKKEIYHAINLIPHLVGKNLELVGRRVALCRKELMEMNMHSRSRYQYFPIL